VVDDNPHNLKLARVLLTGEGYEVRTAADAEEALTVLAGFTPRLVLMDIQLPGMDGLELTRRLKADPARRHIVVVALTAYAMKGDEAKAVAAGCDGYIAKPIDTAALTALVADLLLEERIDTDRVVAMPIDGDDVDTARLISSCSRARTRSGGWPSTFTGSSTRRCGWPGPRPPPPRPAAHGLRSSPAGARERVPTRSGISEPPRERGRSSRPSPRASEPASGSRSASASSRRWGGEITITSDVGKGTMVRVMIPAGEIQEDEFRSVPRVQVAPRRGRILVVDDEAPVASVIRRALGREHEVQVLTSATEAFRRLDGGERYDVILCDLMMPVMTGMELHAELTRAVPDQAACIIFLTGGAFTPGARTFLDQVPNPRLEKPFQIQALRGLVNERLH
jgi:CheY-like chemotaxis protein